MQNRLDQVERKSEQLTAFVTDRRRTPARSLTPIALPAFRGKRPPVEGSSLAIRRDETRGSAVADYLHELRDRVGADEVILWRANPDGAVAAVTWSSAVAAGNGRTPDHDASQPSRGGQAPDGPPCFNRDAWLPLVEWSAKQRLLQCERDGESVAFAVTPIVDDARGYCALSVSSTKSLRATVDELKSWLPRAGAQAASLADLVHTLRQYERQVRQANVLVNSAKMFQSKRSVDGLGQTVVRDALQLTAGTTAALVKWDGDARVGLVQSVSPGHSMEPGQRVFAQSIVGECCAEDQSQTWEDARPLNNATPIYGPEGAATSLASLMVVTLKQEQRVVGAIVVEGDAPLSLLARDIGPVRTLAAIASASLQQLWRMEEVHRASITDQLTGLYNRRHFDHQLLRLLSEADRSGQAVSLIIADADHFKRVNDTFGHDAGDAVLVSVAATVKRAARSDDVCARYGGEEMAVLLPNTPLIEALEIAERLRRNLAAKPVVHNGSRISVTASFGVSSYPDSVSSHGALFPAADRALYAAKSGGRNCVKSNGATDELAAASDGAPRVGSQQPWG